MSDEWNDDYCPVPTAAPPPSNNWRGSNTEDWGNCGEPVNFENVDSNRPRGSQTFYNRNSGRGGGGAGRGRRGGNSGRDWQQQGDRNRSNETCEELHVPSRFVGKIIGRGGSKINELQSQTSCKIQVTKENDGENTLVKLFGDTQAISKAKDLISELTADPFKFVEAKDVVSEEPKEPERKQIVDWKAYLEECDKAAAREWEKYPPVKKDFYQEHPDVQDMTDKEAEAFRLENNNIVVDRTFKKDDSRPIPKPCPDFIHAFHQFPEIMDEIRRAGFEKPSPIQAQAWPVLLSGEDLIGIAQTGTGKTLAFLLPAMIHIDGQPGERDQRGGPAVLVMAPTRELALQIDKEVKKYQYRGITSVCVYGGGNRKDQVKVLTDGVDIVIATPGRLNDLIEAGHLNVKTVTYAVLDEADRMLDMGFEPQIRKVMYAIRPNRQTVMTSATWPLGVRRLAQSYMVDPVQIYVGSLDLAAVHTVTQVIQMFPDDDEQVKFETFMEFVRNLAPDQKVIVFCGRKSKADHLSSELALAGVPCQTLHGDRDQSDREQALLDIADGSVQVLIATDVASRGLDIDDITHVLNYDFPRNIEEYVHRVGRTGRAGKCGESISYFTRGDWGSAKELIPILEEAQQYIPEELYQMAERHDAWKERKEKERASGGGGRGRGGGRYGGGGGRRW